MPGEIFQAKRSFSANGRIVRAGETIREGHPLLVTYPQMFEPLRVVYDVVEQATAGPGEKRATRRKSDEK